MRSASLALLLVTASGLAGCLQDAQDRDDTPAGMAEWDGTSVYGVHLEAVTLHERIEPGTPTTWTIQAVNAGPPGINPVEYNAACAGPFEVTLLGPDGTPLHADEPKMECLAIDEQTLVGGDRLGFDWTWDGQVWSEAAGKEAPPAGPYTLRFAFEGHHNGNPDHLTDPIGETQVYVAGD